MRPILLASASILAAGLLAAATPGRADTDAARAGTIKIEAPKPDAAAPAQTHFTADAVTTDGSVTVGGKPVAYSAIAGTLVVHPKGYDDVPQNHLDEDKDKTAPTEASMFYVAYLRHGTQPGSRPITFLFNGGPGSSSVWLHMGAFGPRRVVTLDDSHTPAAPYQVVDNAQSLLDASDLVFIDAPGTGFSRVAGKDGPKSFYGVDQDAHAFAAFINDFLSKYGRWNSPKYLFGESYGTTRSAVLSAMLTDDYSIDLNGIVLLSQILAFDGSPDGPEANPGLDLPYQLVLPTYTAVAWYHHKLPADANPPANEAGLPKLLDQVQAYALGPYAAALAQGDRLDAATRQAVANQLHLYTGLPVDYLLKANLRVSGGEFTKTLQDDAGLTTGRLDARFSGPTLDPLSKDADYDPQSTAISAAYVAAFNDYARRGLKYGGERVYKAVTDNGAHWDFTHHAPNLPDGGDPIATNVMPDLAYAMKTNPLLHIQLDQGYYDLATPYFQGEYEMRHLPIPPSLAGNIEFRRYDSGHMVYAHQASLQQLHDNVADFIARTSNQGHPQAQPAHDAGAHDTAPQ